MAYSRNVVVDIMKSWIGYSENNGKHKKIIDIYNTISPIPAGYKVKYSDSWCAATISAAFHKAGYDNICPLECSCNRMIAKAQSMGIWVENDSFKPQPGDIILYDWQDSGIGDNKGSSEHVGVVESVSGNTINVIEGNYSDQVKRRQIKVNGKFIRGFITPKFDENQNGIKPSESPKKETIEIVELSKQSTNLYTVGNVYTLQSDMYVRDSANGNHKSYASLTENGKKNGRRDAAGNAILVKGTRVTCKAIKNLGSAIWIKIPSGYICAKGSSGKTYVK